MNPQQIEKIRIAVAGELGIQVIPCTCSDDPWKDAATGKHLPNYPSSLDSCVEFEKDMSKNEHATWRDFLKDICMNDWMDKKHYSAFPESSTPLQRCIAFLRTRNREIPE